MTDIFIEVEFENGDLFRVRDEYEEEYLSENKLGEWGEEEIASGSSGAEGYLESLAQSDEFSGFFFRSAERDLEVIRVKTWRANDG